MENTKISIIVPVYNAEKYLSKCLNSLMNQTYKNLEIICINDGSTDSSYDVLTRYARSDKRIIIHNQQNCGPSATRNVGLEIATGNYIVFVDSDDWLDWNTCENALRAVLMHDADVVLWPYIKEYTTKSLTTNLFANKTNIWIDTEVIHLHTRMIGLIEQDLYDPSKLDSPVTVWGKMYRKSVLKNQRFVDTQLIGTGEDVLFNISVFFNVYRAVYISDTYYHYFKANSTSFTGGGYRPNLVLQWKELFRQIQAVLIAHQAPTVFFEALSNRIALGIIQLGIIISLDSTLSHRDKIQELQRILTMEHYKTSLSSLPIAEMPFHWKTFFFCAKHRLYTPLLCLLHIMNRLKKII